MNLGFFVFVLGALFQSRKLPVVSGWEHLVGAEGIVLTDFEESGQVRVQGEIWQAQSRTVLVSGQSVRVTSLNGLLL